MDSLEIPLLQRSKYLVTIALPPALVKNIKIEFL